MSEQHIKDVLSRKAEQQPQFDYLWRTVMPRLDVYSDGSGADALTRYVGKHVVPQQDRYIDSYGPNGAELAIEVSHRVYEFNAPFHSFDPRKSTDKLSFRYAANHHDIGAITMTIDEMEDGLTLKYLQKWRSLMTNPDGSRNPPAYYKKPIFLFRRTKTQLDSHFTEYVNCFPTEISPVAHNYESNQVLQYSVTLTLDDAKFRYNFPETANNQVIQEILNADNRTRKRR